MDVIGFWRFSELTGCYNTTTGKGSGSTDCVSNYGAAMSSQPQCVCSSSLSSTHCYSYDLSRGDDCTSIMGTYTRQLLASLVILVLIISLVLVHIVVVSQSVCVPDRPYDPTVNDTNEGLEYSEEDGTKNMAIEMTDVKHHDSSSSSSSSMERRGEVHAVVQKGEDDDEIEVKF